MAPGRPCSHGRGAARRSSRARRSRPAPSRCWRSRCSARAASPLVCWSSATRPSSTCLASCSSPNRHCLAWRLHGRPFCRLPSDSRRWAILLSVATRSSAAGIGLPVVIGLLMQLVAFVDGPEEGAAPAPHQCVRRLARCLVPAGLSRSIDQWHGGQRHLSHRLPADRLPSPAETRDWTVDVSLHGSETPDHARGHGRRGCPGSPAAAAATHRSLRPGSKRPSPRRFPTSSRRRCRG